MSRSFNAPLLVMVLISLAIGALVIAITTYGFVAERRRELGSLKAIGARNGRLYRVVSAQALAIATLALVAGVALAQAAAAAIEALWPKFLFVSLPSHYLLVVAAALVMGTRRSAGAGARGGAARSCGGVPAVSGNVPIAWRNLSRQRLRLALSVGGVGMALLMILALDGIYAAILDRVTAYPDNHGAPLIGSQRGVSTMHMSSSTVPQRAVERLRSDPRVERAEPIL